MKNRTMKADYHVHTEFSDDSEYQMEQVVRDSIVRDLMKSVLQITLIMG